MRKIIYAIASLLRTGPVDCGYFRSFISEVKQEILIFALRIKRIRAPPVTTGRDIYGPASHEVVRNPLLEALRLSIYEWLNFFPHITFWDPEI